MTKHRLKLYTEGKELSYIAHAYTLDKISSVHNRERYMSGRVPRSLFSGLASLLICHDSSKHLFLQCCCTVHNVHMYSTRYAACASSLYMYMYIRTYALITCARRP